MKTIQITSSPNMMPGTTVGMYSVPSIVSVDVTPTRVRIVKRASPNFTYSITGPNSRPPDKIWAEIWDVKDGILVRGDDVYGEHTPQTIVPESITFHDSPQ